jgi:hypothetical protein
VSTVVTSEVARIKQNCNCRQTVIIQLTLIAVLACINAKCKTSIYNDVGTAEKTSRYSNLNWELLIESQGSCLSGNLLNNIV